MPTEVFSGSGDLHDVRSARPPEAEPAAAAETRAVRVTEPATAETRIPTASAEPVREAAPTWPVTIVPLAMEASGAIEPRGAEHDAAAPVAAGNGTPVRRRVLGPVELPPARRPSAGTLAGLAAAAGIAALALGSGAIAVAVRDADGDGAAAAADARRAVAVLSKPSTERVPLEGSGRRLLLAVGSGSRAFLVLRGLEAAPSGKAYEAWVVQGAAPARPAGLFSGDERLVRLTRLVPPGATVGVTLESEAGRDVPSARFLFVAQRPGR